VNDQNEKLAQRVVEAFEKHVSAEAREHISERDLNVLALIVREALSLEMAEAVEMVDELEERLKNMEGRRELGL
jgi:pyridoxine 5'-phosphate synthase PdxJ